MQYVYYDCGGCQDVPEDERPPKTCPHAGCEAEISHIKTL